jgi:hypothetical protein
VISGSAGNKLQIRATCRCRSFGMAVISSMLLCYIVAILDIWYT